MATKFDGAEQVARRVTSDGHHVTLWSDGSLLLPLGQFIPGWGGKRLPGRAGWLVMGEVELYDLEEVPTLAEACRWAAKHGKTPGEMRAHLHRDAPIRLVWTVMHADRDGRPTVRTCRLNRIQWPGLIVWHERGVYELLKTERPRPGGDTCLPTGFKFRTLRDLTAHLRGIAS